MITSYDAEQKEMLDENEKMRTAKEQGIEQGKFSKATKVAKKMILRGDSNEDIAEITELSIEQIEELRRSLK